MLVNVNGQICELVKADIYYGPQGGRYRDPEHKVPYIGERKVVGENAMGQPLYEGDKKQGPSKADALASLKAAIANPHPEDMRTAMIKLAGAARESGDFRSEAKALAEKVAGMKSLPPAAQATAKSAVKVLDKMVKKWARLNKPKKGKGKPAPVQPLKKAEAKGGNYHRRVPRKNGKGYTYYYDEGKYAASRNAHLDGPATRSARLTKAVLGAVDGAGKKGCAVKSLRDMAKREGKDHVAAAIKGCIENGDLTLKKGVLYRKALKKELEDNEGSKKAPMKKARVRRGPDLLLKSRGHRYISKKWVRDHWEYTYPEDIKKKPPKKKPTKPSPQLSLFGQTTLQPKEPVEAKTAEHVAEKPHEERATIEVEQQRQEPRMMTRQEFEEHSEAIVQREAERFAEREAERKALTEWAEKERAKTPEQKKAELEALQERWRAVPRSGKGWQLITKPLPEVRRKRWVEDTVAKIEKLPIGAKVRVRTLDGKTADWRVMEGGKVTLEGLTKDTPMPAKYALPEIGGAVNAQVEVNIPKDVKEAAAKRAAEKKAQEAEHPPQEGESGLPEIPPKPPKPAPIPYRERNAEMRRRWSEQLYSTKKTYAVKEEIKDVGGVWDRYNNTWLLPSKEALDYIEAIIPHKEAEQSADTDKAISEGRTVSGRTWDVRDQIKKHGGRWHAPTKQWIMPDKQSTEMMQTLVDRTTKGSWGSSGGTATARQIEVASAMMQKVSAERWKATIFGSQGIDIPRARAMLPELSMLQASELIATMKG